MKQIKLGPSQLSIPAVAVGCMRFAGMDQEKLNAHIRTCLDLGLNFFDHADIYGGGACEEKFARAIKALGTPRDALLLQSKCGIRRGFYDFSKEYILSSVESILRRLDTDYLDVLVLHRPDALVEPGEVAEAFDELERSGKVRHFGVSNHRSGQIELLRKYLRQPLAVNQLQMSLPASTMIAAGLEANMATDGAVDRDGGVLDYCRLHDITIQVWSPFQYGFFEGPFVGNREKFPELNDALDALSGKYGASPTALAAAWVLRHPAGMQLIAGTTDAERMAEIAGAADIVLSREDWYKLYLSAGHILP